MELQVNSNRYSHHSSSLVSNAERYPSDLSGIALPRCSTSPPAGSCFPFSFSPLATAPAPFSSPLAPAPAPFSSPPAPALPPSPPLCPRQRPHPSPPLRRRRRCPILLLSTRAGARTLLLLSARAGARPEVEVEVRRRPRGPPPPPPPRSRSAGARPRGRGLGPPPLTPPPRSRSVSSLAGAALLFFPVAGEGSILCVISCAIQTLALDLSQIQFQLRFGIRPNSIPMV